MALFNHVTKPGDKNQGWARIRRLSPWLFGCLVILLSGVFPPPLPFQLKSRLLLGNNCRRAEVATKPPPPRLQLRFSQQVGSQHPSEQEEQISAAHVKQEQRRQRSGRALARCQRLVSGVLFLTERNLTFLAPTKSSRAARMGQGLGLGVFDPSVEKRELFGRMQGVGR